MRTISLRAALSCGLAIWLIGAQLEARSVDSKDLASAETAATRELLEGTRGRREAWGSVPSLLVLTSVMEYNSTNMASGYVATGERLTADEIAELTSDLTRGLDELTGGGVTAFSAIHVEAAETGQIVKVLRQGQIVVGRFVGVRAKTGSLGYGGRMTWNGAIAAASVILDREFDRDSAMRQLLRTHELGHALGYNHVESLPSVMNPRVGTGMTDFDRTAMKLAFAEFAPPPAVAGPEPPSHSSDVRQPTVPISPFNFVIRVLPYRVEIGPRTSEIQRN